MAKETETVSRRERLSESIVVSRCQRAFLEPKSRRLSTRLHGSGKTPKEKIGRRRQASPFGARNACSVSQLRGIISQSRKFGRNLLRGTTFWHANTATGLVNKSSRGTLFCM